MFTIRVSLCFGGGGIIAIPAEAWRNNNVIITSKRRRFDVIMMLQLRGVYYLTFNLCISPVSQRAHDAIITSSLRPNDVADVVLT